MKIIKKIFKWLGIAILAFILIIVLGTAFVTNYYPSFGGTVTKELKAKYSKADNHNGEKFNFPISAAHDMNFRKGMKYMKDEAKIKHILEPTEPLPMLFVDSLLLTQTPDTQTRVIWFGHSTFLIQMNGKNILIDPVFSDYASPFQFAGPKRFKGDLPIEIEQLPQIDIIILSHDHYDHLDHTSILKLKEKTNQYVLPLGTRVHLERWGVDSSKITELNWWEETTIDSLTFACLPSRHYSGRGLTDRHATLWGSWAIMSSDEKIYFSGDGGYGTHFKEIGDKYGIFDLVLVECGQYNAMWEEVHMIPEKSAQAAIDLNAKMAMPIHWGAFSLAAHGWKEPIERISKAAKELDLKLVTPRIGEPIIIGEQEPTTAWWK
jgi:L-ascorbate metabolism protein UlaG (beta-lactamase superfamily)